MLEPAAQAELVPPCVVPVVLDPPELCPPIDPVLVEVLVETVLDETPVPLEVAPLVTPFAPVLLALTPLVPAVPSVPPDVTPSVPVVSVMSVLPFPGSEEPA
jgi:hypothetical protein